MVARYLAQFDTRKEIYKGRCCRKGNTKVIQIELGQMALDIKFNPHICICVVISNDHVLDSIIFLSIVFLKLNLARAYPLIH